MNKLKQIVAWVLLGSTWITIGCRKQTSLVAVIPRTTATLLWEPLHLGVAEEARGSGLRVYWNAPSYEGDTERQISMFSAARLKGYRGIIFAPDETFASRSVVLEAVADQIPVVIVDDQLGPPTGRYLSYVSTDEAAGASLAAQRIAKLLHGHGTIAILGISPRLESGLTREQYFARALALEAPDIHVSARRFGDSVVTHQQQIAQAVLIGKEHVDAIVALSATATRGAYYAKLATEPQQPVIIVGFDQDLLLPVLSGEVDSVVVQNTLAIGKIAMHNLDSQILGEAVKGVTLVPPILLTRETLNSPEVTNLWKFSLYHWAEQ